MYQNNSVNNQFCSYIHTCNGKFTSTRMLSRSEEIVEIFHGRNKKESVFVIAVHREDFLELCIVYKGGSNTKIDFHLDSDFDVF